MAEKPQASPKVFVSYCWTNEAHVEWVRSLSEKLMSDGVDVVLDRWSLEDGHDVNVFMESMVNDSTIKRVIIVSDAKYALKADSRAGGVGTETQIISKKVYDSVAQTKFIPILRERDQAGKACLPLYLQSRKYIDFSDADTEAEGYDQLLRNIFERPSSPKPAIGKPPSHLFDDEAAMVTSAQKAKRFRDFVASGRGNASAAFQDFADEFVLNFEDLRMVYTREEAETWCERVRANLERANAYRDVFVDAVSVGAAHCPEPEFVAMVVSLLERLLPFQEPPESQRSGFRCSQDNYKVLCYEIFLYTFASFVKAKKYLDARQLVDHLYVAPKALGGERVEGWRYSKFNSRTDSLQQSCAERGGRRSYSVVADLVHDRATNKSVRFRDVLQADVVLCIASPSQAWFPYCLVYGGSVGKLELFLRATTDSGILPLKHLLGLESPQELLKQLNREEMRTLIGSEAFAYAMMDGDCLNYDELRRSWGGT